MKTQDLKSRLFYPVRLSFRIKRVIKGFSDKKKLKEYMTTKPVLHEMLKGLLYKKKINMNKKIKTKKKFSLTKANT